MGQALSGDSNGGAVRGRGPAHYLIALERPDEAEELLAFLTKGARFDGNFNLWSPLASAMVALASLRRWRGDRAGAAQALAPIRQQPHRTPVEPDEPQRAMDDTAKELADADEDTQKWGCLGISRHLMTLLYLRESAIDGFAHSGTYPTDDLDQAIVTCFERLKAKLG